MVKSCVAAIFNYVQVDLQNNTKKKSFRRLVKKKNNTAGIQFVRVTYPGDSHREKSVARIHRNS